ncbi:MAG: DUF5787 family protein [Haloarculaceae archaeon]
MREYGFELALCAHLEATSDDLVSRQLGTGRHGRRVIDVLQVEPTDEFDARAAITPHAIPPRAIEAAVGPGRARDWRAAFDGHPERDRAAVERAVEVGFLERERRGGRTYVRQVARYPDWFGRLRGVENKPDLDAPGDLALQLRKDVSLGLLDEVVLATASYVTGAHLNRLPDAVGVWRFDPETGDRTVVREPTPLDATGPGLEVLDEHPGRTEVRPVSAAETARLRRRLAERAYGKGWRTWTLPACARCAAGAESDAATPGLPACRYHGRLVHPAEECGPDCPGHDPADPPAVDLDAKRARRSPWVADPAGRARRQAGLDHFRQSDERSG